jgi:NAD(P)-dependent dehydrogenase (short-subunit alcohol dehydrogenase family)
MNVALTGATGFIGSHVLTELRAHGHEVTALVRDDPRADIVAARGATPAVVDLYDRPAVASLLSKADGTIHIASPGDATTADLDSAVVDAVIDAFAGTTKPYVSISGLWEYGGQHRHQRGVSPQCACAGGMEGADRTPGPRRGRYARSTGRPCTSRTWRISSGASWKTTRLMATTSSATE